MFFCCNGRKENNTGMDTARYIVLVGWKIVGGTWYLTVKNIYETRFSAENGGQGYRVLEVWKE